MKNIITKTTTNAREKLVSEFGNLGYGATIQFDRAKRYVTTIDTHRIVVIIDDESITIKSKSNNKQKRFAKNSIDFVQMNDYSILIQESGKTFTYNIF